MKNFLVLIFILLTGNIQADDHGNDSTTATVTNISGSISGIIETNDDEDWFKVIFTESGQFTTGTSGTTDTYGYVYSSTDLLLDENDDGDNSPNFSISLPVSIGEYFISVRHFSSKETGGYTLVNNFTPDSQSSARMHVSGSISADHFDFTNEQEESLRGIQGPAGNDGAQGPAGPQGSPAAIPPNCSGDNVSLQWNNSSWNCYSHVPNLYFFWSSSPDIYTENCVSVCSQQNALSIADAQGYLCKNGVGTPHSYIRIGSYQVSSTLTNFNTKFCGAGSFNLNLISSCRCALTL